MALLNMSFVRMDSLSQCLSKRMSRALVAWDILFSSLFYSSRLSGVLFRHIVSSEIILTRFSALSAAIGAFVPKTDI